MKLIIDGQTISERGTHVLINRLLFHKAIKEPEEAQAYFEGFTIEQGVSGRFIRNPHFDGLHFFLHDKDELYSDD